MDQSPDYIPFALLTQDYREAFKLPVPSALGQWIPPNAALLEIISTRTIPNQAKLKLSRVRVLPEPHQGSPS